MAHECPRWPCQFQVQESGADHDHARRAQCQRLHHRLPQQRPDADDYLSVRRGQSKRRPGHPGRAGGGDGHPAGHGPEHHDQRNPDPSARRQQPQRCRQGRPDLGCHSRQAELQGRCRPEEIHLRFLRVPPRECGRHDFRAAARVQPDLDGHRFRQGPELAERYANELGHS